MTVASFPVLISFTSYSSLTAVARTSKTMLNKSVQSGHPCLVLDLKKCFQLFTFEYDVNCRFAICGLYYVEVYSLYIHFLGSFYNKWVLNFLKSFICIYWDDYIVSILSFVSVIYHIDWFVDIEKSLHPWDELTWSWCMIFLMYCWIQSAIIFLRIFASILIGDIGL